MSGAVPRDNRMDGVLRPDVLIIGAGPAGLAAARAALRRGASVTLLDAADSLGGQYWRHLPETRRAAREEILHHGWATYRRLVCELRDAPRCEIILGAQVWALESGRRGDGETTESTDRQDPRDGTAIASPAPSVPLTVHALIGPPDGTGRKPRTIQPRTLVLATGAHDRTLPFPGWDLPGVFTAGAAQAYAKGERVAVGRRVVVAGAGPFLLPVASSLVSTGATVLGVYEASTPRQMIRGWLSKPWQLAGAAHKSGELAGYIRGQLRHRVPYRTGYAVVAAHGEDRVAAVTVARVDAQWAPIPGTARRIEADAVCVSHGFTPRLELAIAAGCALSPDRFVVVDADQRTSVPGVFAAGEITRIGGVDAALAEGELAGHAAAGGCSADAAVVTARRSATVFTGFAARIEAAHGIQPGWTAWLTEDTIVCRCEEVTYGRFCSTLAATGGPSLRSLRMTTRAGLGVCQARVCGRTVEDLLIGEPTVGVAEVDIDHTRISLPAPVPVAVSDRRPITTPVRLAELAAMPPSPSARPSVPSARPSVPSAAPSVPSAAPSVPSGSTPRRSDPTPRSPTGPSGQPATST